LWTLPHFVDKRKSQYLPIKETGMGKVKERKTYDRQFKNDAVNLVINGSRTVAEVSRDLGVKAYLLYRWIREQGREKAKGEEAFPGKGRLGPQEEELRRLRRELEEAKEDREILKKALEFFSKHGK
jgi:transposase